MTAKRTADFSLSRAVKEPSFTPRARDFGALVDLLEEGEQDLVEDTERAIVRIGAPALPQIAARLDEAPPWVRASLARVLGRLAGQDAAARPPLLDLLQDADPVTRRDAAIAAGKLRGPEVEAALLAAWEREDRAPNRRSLAEALGKAGGRAALDRLTLVSAGEDAVVGRALERARIMLSRSLGRTEESRVDASRRARAPVPIVLHCRAGLAPLVVDELGGGASAEAAAAHPTGCAMKARVVAPDRVEAMLSGPLESVFCSRTMMEVGFPLPEQRGEIGQAVVRALTSPQARRIFETWTVGPIRYRLEWAEGGHRRSLGWRCAEQVAAKAPSLVNDPTGSTWEAIVTQRGETTHVELRPRKLVDPRFAYRRGDVPAASHPTIAAALAYIAGARKDDVVWDPFVGSGLELVERTRRGPWRALHGTDRDPKALAAARANLSAAGIGGAVLAVADATRHAVPGVTLVITNPPMGRRLERGNVDELLDRFVDHVGEVLAPGGRFVWISPLPRRTLTRARKAGLTLDQVRDVDMGGFPAQIQSFRKAQRPPRR